MSAFLSGESREALCSRLGAASFSAIVMETGFCFPFDTLKSLMQVSANAGNKLSAAALVEGVAASSGTAGLYGGLGWHLLGRLPVLGVRYGVYELITAFQSDGRSENVVSLSETFLAGLMAGMLESIVATPCDFLKLRAQVTAATTNHSQSPNRGHSRTSSAGTLSMTRSSHSAAQWALIGQSLSVLPGKPSNVIAALKDYPWLATGSGQPPLVKDVGGFRGAVSLEGWSALWRGLRPGMFRDGVYGGTFFCGWQCLDDLATEWRAYRQVPPPSSWEEVKPSTPLQLSVSAGLAAALAASVSHSFDTAKIRAQAMVVPKHMNMEGRLLKLKVPGTWTERIVGFNPFDRSLLNRGLGLRALQHGVGTFALVGTFHAALWRFQEMK